MKVAEHTRAIILLLILIAIGGLVLFGKDKSHHKILGPLYESSR